MEGDAFSVPMHHWLIWIYRDFGRCLYLGGHKLHRSFKKDFGGVDGFGGAGLSPRCSSSSSHSSSLVAPVPIHSDKDVVGQGVEVDPCEIRGPLRGLPVLLQDPEEDVADNTHIRNAAPGSEGGVRTRGSLCEEQQLLFIQPNGVHQGKDLLTEIQKQQFFLRRDNQTLALSLQGVVFNSTPSLALSPVCPAERSTLCPGEMQATTTAQAAPVTMCKNDLAKETFHSKGACSFCAL